MSSETAADNVGITEDQQPAKSVTSSPSQRHRPAQTPKSKRGGTAAAPDDAYREEAGGASQ